MSRFTVLENQPIGREFHHGIYFSDIPDIPSLDFDLSTYAYGSEGAHNKVDMGSGQDQDNRPTQLGSAGFTLCTGVFLQGSVDAVEFMHAVPGDQDIVHVGSSFIDANGFNAVQEIRGPRSALTRNLERGYLGAMLQAAVNTAALESEIMVVRTEVEGGMDGRFALFADSQKNVLKAITRQEGGVAVVEYELFPGVSEGSEFGE